MTIKIAYDVQAPLIYTDNDKKHFVEQKTRNLRTCAIVEINKKCEKQRERSQWEHFTKKG